MATMINKINDAELEQEILGAMNLYAASVKGLQEFRNENPLQMAEKRARAYVNAQRKATKAELEICELARVYPSTFKKLTSTFRVQ